MVLLIALLAVEANILWTTFLKRMRENHSSIVLLAEVAQSNRGEVLISAIVGISDLNLENYETSHLLG